MAIPGDTIVAVQCE